MKMDLATIRHVATLAELTLSPEEEEKMAEEIGRIVAYVKELEAVDTTGVEPAIHAGQVGAEAAGWRDDDVAPSLPHDEALKNAPKAGHEGFVVPTFVE